MAIRISQKTLQAAHRERVMGQQSERPVTLEWAEGAALRRVPAREGVATVAIAMELGAAVDQRAIKFEVLRELLAVAPEISTVLTVVQRRPEAWRLMRITAGTSATDPCWMFECVEESD